MRKRKIRDPFFSDRSVAPIVVRYADRLKQLYVVMRNRFDSRYVSFPSSEERSLTELAEILYRMDADPADFVHFCFLEFYAGLFGNVMMGHMKSRSLLSEYGKRAEERKKEDETAISCQIFYVESWLANGIPIEEILTNPCYALGPVMRYALAKAFGLTELLSLFERDARTAAEFCAEFRSLLGWFMPGENSDGREDVEGGESEGSRISGTEDLDGPFGAERGDCGQRVGISSRYGFQP